MICEVCAEPILELTSWANLIWRWAHVSDAPHHHLASPKEEKS